MAITNEQLDHLAKLCRIALSDEEKTRIGGQLNQIIAFVEQLQACEVEGIEPMSHPQEGVSLQPRQIEESPGAEGDLNNPEEQKELAEKFLKNVKHPVVDRQIEVRSSLS